MIPHSSASRRKSVIAEVSFGGDQADLAASTVKPGAANVRIAIRSSLDFPWEIGWENDAKTIGKKPLEHYGNRILNEKTMGKWNLVFFGGL